MTKRRLKKTKSAELLDFILQNPGMNIDEISQGLGWSYRSVKLALAKLERERKISTRYFASVVKKVEDSTLGIDKEIAFGKNKLEKMLTRLQERAKETFEKCVEAKMTKDEDLAMVYANQCAEIKKLINAVVASENIFNRMDLAMESLKLSLRKRDSLKD